MFTGLIEAVGTVERLAAVPSGYRLVVRADLVDQLRAGDSLAVNGVCLTAVTLDRGAVSMDLGPETAAVTTLGALQPGQPVNLERPLRADARLGGHLVQGHVDGVGEVESVRRDGECHWVHYRFPDPLAAYFVPKGAVAVDGVSLTIVDVEAERVSVQIIPFTWTHTNVQYNAIGDRVNLECDVIGKFVVRAMALTNAGRAMPSTE